MTILYSYITHSAKLSIVYEYRSVKTFYFGPLTIFCLGLNHISPHTASKSGFQSCECVTASDSTILIF